MAGSGCRMGELYDIKKVPLRDQYSEHTMAQKQPNELIDYKKVDIPKYAKCKKYKDSDNSIY